LRGRSPFDISFKDPYSVLVAEEEGIVCTLAKTTDGGWKF
jgi:hypothetical protein